MPRSTRQNVIDPEVLQRLLTDGYTILTPNLRLCRTIAKQWNHIQQSSGQVAWHSTAVSPLEPWLLQQWHGAVDKGLLPLLVPASPAQLQELWQEVIAEHQTATQGYTLIGPTGAATQASRARDTLIRWRVDINDPACKQLFMLDEDCSTFFAWQALLVAKLKALEMASNSDSLLGLLSCAHELPRQKIALAGFDDIPPLLRACVDALGEQLLTLPPHGKAGEISVQECPDKRTELAAAAHWAKALYEQNVDAEMAIIVPDMHADRPSLEYLLRREFDCLGSNYTSLPVNFSAGIAMDEVPLVRDAIRALSMCRQRIDLDDIVALLQSRFVSLPDQLSGAAIQFIRRLFDRGEQKIDAGDVRYLASRCRGKKANSGPFEPGEEGLQIGQILLELSGRRDLRGRALVSQWLDRFSEILSVWGWPGLGPLDSIEYQQLNAWYDFLDQFSAYDQICGPKTFEEALQLLTRAAAGVTSQPQTPESNLQVLGQLEAAGQSFDYLWIVGMQAGQWPAAARPNPFIPLQLQRELNMPQSTAAREWSFSSTLMSQYQRSATQIIASYSVQNEGVPEKGSALLDDLPRLAAIAADIINPHWTALQKQSRSEQLSDNCGPSLDRGELSAGRGGSGLLEDQSQCPFRAFAKRRLGIQPLPQQEIALSAAERGTVLHDALYLLWGEVSDSTKLTAMSEVDLGELITTSVSQALQKIASARRNALGDAYFDLEARRLQSLLAQWTEVEKQRSPFVVAAREQEIQLQLGSLQISMRADRIDVLPDGARFVIDYKSGLSTPQDWLGDRPAKPQLPLYALAMEETVAGLAFAQVRRNECKYTGAGQFEVAKGVHWETEKWVKDKMPVKDWEDLCAQWRDNLERLADDFLRGEASVDPVSNSCTFCGLQPLCRIDEQQELLS